jgi:hypothetical protein
MRAPPRADVVDAGLPGQRLEVVPVHDLGPVVQVDVGDRGRRFAVPGGAHLDPAVQRTPDVQQDGVLVGRRGTGVGARVGLLVTGQWPLPCSAVLLDPG